MADVKAIRDALKTRIESIGNVANLGQLFVYDTMQDTPVVPCAIVLVPPGNSLAEVTLDGAEDLALVVLVLVQKTVDGAAQDNLDTYLSSGSADLVEALETGTSQHWDFVAAGPRRGYGAYTFGAGEAAQQFLGFEIPLTVGVS